jgi:hypothetical protein
MAVVSKPPPVDIFTGQSREPDLGSQLNPMGLSRQPQMLDPKGLMASQMTRSQKQLLRTLVMDYISRPTFLIEYMNTSWNHNHSVCRGFNGADFGEDPLRDDYASVPHEGTRVIPTTTRASR